MKKLSVAALMLVSAVGCPSEKPEGQQDQDAASNAASNAASGAAADQPTDPAASAIPTAETPKPPAPLVKSAIAALPMEAPILIIDDVIFQRADLERAITQHAASAGIPPESLDDQVRAAFEEPAYEKLLERHLLSTEAKRRGLWPKDEAVRAEREKILHSIPPALTVETFLKKLNTDDAGFQKEIATDMALGKLFEVLQKEQKAPDAAAVRKFYDDNKDKFVAPETASASHILLTLARDAPEAEVAETMKRAEQIRKEVAGKDKATFARVALAKSQDPRAKENKGDLGSFPRGVLVSALDTAVFKLKDGEVSEVVRSDFGLHIIRGQGIKAPGPRTFEEVKPTIVEREGARIFMASLEKLFVELRAKAKTQRLVEPAKSPFTGAAGVGHAAPSKPAVIAP